MKYLKKFMVLVLFSGIALCPAIAQEKAVEHPRFVKTDYIESDKMFRISKFRSSIGHNYSDSFESCRSMKHYYCPKTDIDWGSVKLFSPVDGKVVRIREEWAGTQVHIQSSAYPDYIFIIFHINPDNPFTVGDSIGEGQFLGTHIGPQTMSDIAVAVNKPEGRALISFFELMSNELLETYKALGLTSKADVIISKEEREAHMIRCEGEKFVSEDPLESWFVLK